MTVVYVAGPYAGKTPREIDRNVRRAIAVGALAARSGYAPIVPHVAGWAGVYGDPLEGNASPDILGASRERAIRSGCRLAFLTGVSGGMLWVIEPVTEGVAREQAEFGFGWSSVRNPAEPAIVSRTWEFWSGNLRLAGLESYVRAADNL